MKKEKTKEELIIDAILEMFLIQCMARLYKDF